MDGAEPEFFLKARVWTEPRFEILVGSLPVMPVSRNGMHGGSFGAKVVNVKWL